MTTAQALKRAALIWGSHRLINVIAKSPDGWWVSLRPAGVASDTRDRNYCAHQLDIYGNAVCHKDCADLELEADHG